MLTDEIEKALNGQVASEAYASAYYMAMASWCDQQGLRNCAAFLYEQADEEREHMMKLFHYVNDAGGHAVVPAVEAPPKEFNSVAEVFKLTYQHELEVTQSINRLVELCFTAKDYSSFHFLQWYVAEQHEEEKLFQTILDIIGLAGTDGKGLLFIDNEIAKLRSSINHK